MITCLFKKRLQRYDFLFQLQNPFFKKNYFFLRLSSTRQATSLNGLKQSTRNAHSDFLILRLVLSKNAGLWKDVVLLESHRLDNHAFLHRLIRNQDQKELASMRTSWK